eukprot:TRINITY_DN17916_c0_g1_i1.p2 TRINITY_DN17916_c0_g1~~TRINITY_DN17916_c0_g1_i1.p2  ORF type:complete len:482 (+),score=259.44 TRINITY_DN17916_c0_g1_i1:102-1448(+)
MALVPAGDQSLDIAEVSREHGEQDGELRALMKELKELDRSIADHQREKHLLEEQRMLTELQVNKLQRYDRINAAPLDPDTAAKIQQLRNQHALNRKLIGMEVKDGTRRPTAQQSHKGTTLFEHQFTVKRHYQEKDERLRELRAELEDTKLRTNWELTAHGPAATRDYRAVENRIKETKLALAQMEDEQRMHKQISAKKTELIEQLSHQIETLRDVDLQCRDAQEQLKQKQVEKTDLVEDIKTLRRIHAKKESLMKDLAHHHGKKDPATIKKLEADKRVLQHDIQKKTDERRTKDKTIQAQHRRLLALESKLATMGAALRSLKKYEQPDDAEASRFRPDVPPGAAQVDAVLYEQAQRNLLEQRRGLEITDIKLMERDAEVESLEKKVEIHAHAKRSMLQRLRHERTDMDRERAYYEQAREEAEGEQRGKLDRLKKELEEAERLQVSRSP